MENPKKPLDLRDLANRWALKARDFARDSKTQGATEVQMSYNRGIAEGYYKAATELAEFMKANPHLLNPAQTSTLNQGGRRSVSPTGSLDAEAVSSPASVSTPSPAASTPKYADISIGEALEVLGYANVNVRDIAQNKDGSFSAVFSRWENVMPHVRVEQVQSADPRIVILGTGKVKDTNDPTIDFAFQGG